MSRLKGGGLLLVMGIPLVLYCALQVKGIMRPDMMASDPPADRGGTKEQLTAARAKSSAWLAEVRKATTIAGQYRAAGGDDATADADTKAAVKAAADRAADLNDLDLFLSDVERPTFAGRLKPQYEKWMSERKELKRDADAVVAWLAKPPSINSAADASKALEAVNSLITQYSGRSRFSDNAKAAFWRIQARLKIIDALAALTNAQYREAVKEKLPLEPGTNKVKTAVDTLRGLKTQIDDLNKAVKQAEEEKVTLDAATRAAVEAKGAVADECAAREELLALFAKDDLFTNPNGAAPWLKAVAAQYRKSKDEKLVKPLIREKVQEFCEAFIPQQGQLDEYVIIKGQAVLRKDVVIKFQAMAGGKVERKPLSSDLDGVNEFNLAAKHPGETTFVVYMGSEEYPRDLKPTELSKAAVLFNAERKKLPDGTAAPKWTAKSAEELKKKCEAQKDLVDQLQTPGRGSAGNTPKIWTRLSGLATGMASNPDLFEAGQ